ncbi:unnamed protein product, partial [Strongylus vulgaris]
MKDSKSNEGQSSVNSESTQNSMGVQGQTEKPIQKDMTMIDPKEDQVVPSRKMRLKFEGPTYQCIRTNSMAQGVQGNLPVYQCIPTSEIPPAAFEMLAVPAQGLKMQGKELQGPTSRSYMGMEQRPMKMQETMSNHDYMGKERPTRQETMLNSDYRGMQRPTEMQLNRDYMGMQKPKRFEETTLDSDYMGSQRPTGMQGNRDYMEMQKPKRFEE